MRTELGAVKRAPEMVSEMGDKRLIIEIDSKVVVEGLMGNGYAEMNPNFLLVHEIQKQMARNWWVRVQHVYREENQSADWLGGHGTALQIGVWKFQQPPRG